MFPLSAKEEGPGAPEEEAADPVGRPAASAARLRCALEGLLGVLLLVLLLLLLLLLLGGLARPLDLALDLLVASFRAWGRALALLLVACSTKTSV